MSTDMLRVNRHPIWLLLLLLVKPHLGFSQSTVPTQSRVQIKKNTSGVSCFNPDFGPRLVRSPVLQSPDGRYRAYVEVRAKTLPPTEKEGIVQSVCENTSRLFLAGPDDKTFRIIHRETRDKYSDGNSLKLIDWSQDSRYLFVKTETWLYESEWGYAGILILDANASKVLIVSPYKAFDIYFGKKCSLVVDILGFSSDDNLVLTASPDEMGDGDECVSKEGLWRFNPHDKTVSPMPKWHTLQHYGKWVETKSEGPPPSGPDQH